MKTALTVITVQLTIIFLLGIVVLSVAKASHAIAAVTGGGVSLVTTVLMSLRLFCGKTEYAPERFLRRLYLAELQKIVLTVLLFFAVLFWTELNFAMCLTGFAVTTLACWFSLPLTGYIQTNLFKSKSH